MVDSKSKNFRRFFKFGLILFIVPLVVFHCIYPPYIAWCQEHILQPFYFYLMERDISLTFAMNMRVLVKGFLFTVLLAICWFPSTLVMRYLYFRLLEGKKHPGIFDER